ncbi:MAG: geranylgeranylglyceryl/heptaprenylglyceryl phosphate synthase [Bacteroidetes bacterium]|nr:MAG: geranylgeranylglyceryl/heptaprenylglyceryl phosphate synthase [Bacteroidota bacterium]
MIYNNILQKKKNKKKQLALLIDPDKQNTQSLIEVVQKTNENKVDFILIGGSIISNSINDVIETVKKNCSIPIVLFPGSLLQVSNKADGILLLSLISGRNPDFLIGNHVVAAPLLKKSKLEILSTGYILINSGVSTSVAYMSNSTPIPYDKTDIAVATAIAGEMLGHKLIYLEAGSGAPKPVDSKMVEQVKQNINVPLIVGGGISTKNDLISICDAGADIIVIGTAFEKNLNLLNEFSEVIQNY